MLFLGGNEKGGGSRPSSAGKRGSFVVVPPPQVPLIPSSPVCHSMPAEEGFSFWAPNRCLYTAAVRQPLIGTKGRQCMIGKTWIISCVEGDLSEGATYRSREPESPISTWILLTRTIQRLFCGYGEGRIRKIKFLASSQVRLLRHMKVFFL